MTDLEIKGFIPSSFLDWDGKIVSTLFLPYCNFRCPFCHNAGLIDHPQTFETIFPERIKNHLLENRDFIDGLCITGGEPFLHKEQGLFEFIKNVKDLGFLVKMDTNGSDAEALSRALNEKLLDYVAMDIKAPLDERYQKLAGVKVDLSQIRQSIKIIRESGIHYEFRVTVVPGLLDTAEIEAIAEVVAGSEKLVLQQFSPAIARDENLRSIQPYISEKFTQLAENAKKFVPHTMVRGV